MVTNRVEYISRHFGEYFDADIKEAYHNVLLDQLILLSLC